eukprot:TRINITY_DN76868_c0_g1_i1.p1 TRINITY_DN76868_c0_g1~~TRINITY_DN76868_c0_g1_i1.p1  ORF type:complete len:609 (-),score=124.35 TRINITY_DN76868_c0_g1_i1:22-1848(-)
MISESSPCDCNEGAKVIGVMGGSFNPIHLGHALLAITVRETKSVDEVLLVPVFNHPVKKDLLPFEDRVAMCKLAVSANGIQVSSVEEETGESNVVMLRALRRKYPPGSQLLWVCGDDVFEWIDNERGRAMMCELDGLIVQRRLHKTWDGQADRFYKAPLDSGKVSKLVAEHGMQVDFIYGELPHYSSTLVRNSPASWRAFLPQKVAAYLDQRPALLAELVRTGDAPTTQVTPPASPEGSLSLALLEDLAQPAKGLDTAAQELADYAGQLPRLLSSRMPSFSKSKSPKETSQYRMSEASRSCVMRCLAVIHALQRERGHTAVAMASKGSSEEAKSAQALKESRAATDELLRDDAKKAEEPLCEAGPSAAGAVMQELARTQSWLTYDRAILDRHYEDADKLEDTPLRWMQYGSLLDKFNVRLEVLLDACVRALGEFLEWGRNGYPQAQQTSSTCASSDEWLLSLFQQYAQCKEALGRLRAFVCAGGPHAPVHVKGSLRLRSRLNEIIEHKDRMQQRVLSMEKGGPSCQENPGAFTVAALHKMLASVTRMEWQLTGCFAASTPLELMHEALAAGCANQSVFDMQEWWGTLSSAIDVMVKLDQVLAAFICTA